MKGVLLGICPDVTLVDITHEIPPHDVRSAGLELVACYRDFPAGTVFLVVVDPGVGSSRRGLVTEIREYRFVAPDNGVLSDVIAEAAPKRVVDLTERKYQRSLVSRTFEGRDRFAPAAAWLARGVPLIAFGRSVTDYVLHPVRVPSLADGVVTGEIVRVDRFGNLISNIDRATFEPVVRAGRLALTVGAHDVARVVGTYAEAPAGDVCALFGSSGHLEIAVNGGSAADRLGLAIGAPVVVRPE